MDDPAPNPEPFLGPYGQELRYEYIIGLTKGNHYQMRLNKLDAKFVIAAVNQGIDARLEACYMPHRRDNYYPDEGHLFCEVSPQSLPVLVRRLCEMKHDNTEDEDRCHDLVTGILVTLEEPEEP